MPFVAAARLGASAHPAACNGRYTVRFSIVLACGAPTLTLSCALSATQRTAAPPNMGAPASPRDDVSNTTHGPDGDTVGALSTDQGVERLPHGASDRRRSSAYTAPPPDPRQVARARRLVSRGLLAYRKGDYDRAEELLKHAIAIHPFLPRANLTLGKIFLIRGSADRDPALISSARLMFEMARALDPELREPDTLLELFAPPPEQEPEPASELP